MKKDIYFISDCHFKPIPNHQQHDVRAKFNNFLADIAATAKRLYIVGDCFDFWFDYKYVIPKYLFDVLWNLQKLNKQGCEIHILGGNHDYWLGDFFSNNGIIAHFSDIEITYQNKNFFITHGDGKLDIDPYYPYLKKVLRNRFVIKLFRLVHPDLAFRIADFVSRSSRSKDPDSTQDLMEIYDAKLADYSQRKFAQGYDFIITGHYHYPKVLDDGDSRFINLGDWVKHFTYGCYSAGELTLESYDK